MTHEQRIIHLLYDKPDLCDDCIAAKLGIFPRQTVRSVCEKSESVVRIAGDARCSACGKKKFVRRTESINSPTPNTPKLERVARISTRASHVDCYSREEDLRAKFNLAVSSVLKIESKDYYRELTFSDLMTLKSGFARIHDIVTLKLAMAMARWVGWRFQLEPNQIVNIVRRVDSTHPNASGFDIDCSEPNVIAEVKGNVPMNAGQRFGPAQLNGLTNDVFGMLGLPSLGKKDDELKRKIQRANRTVAYKFLGLIDSREVRSATLSWISYVNRLLEPHKYQVKNEPHSGEFETDVVYMVYLVPETLSPNWKIEGAI